MIQPKRIKKDGMEFLQNYWLLFIVSGFGLTGLLGVIAKNRTTDVQPGMATKSDQFSMRTVFLSIRSGEAPLFFTVLGVTVCFFLFSVGFCKEISSLLPG